MERLQEKEIRLDPVPIYKILESYKDCVHIFLQNIRSFNAHYQDVVAIHNIEKCDFILLTQTRHTKPPPESFKDSHHHQMLHCSHNVGGLIVYAKYVTSNCTYHNDDFMQAITFEYFTMNEKIFVALLYCHPHATVKQLLPKIEQMILSSKAQRKYVLGDINIPKHSTKWKTFQKFMHSKCFTQMVTTPTHISSSIIDHVWTTNPSSIVHCTCHETYYSDHFPVFLSLEK